MDISKEMSARFTNMSFVCACLVVLIHIEICPEFGAPLWWVEQLFAHKGMTNVAVPFFFLSSGFFLAGNVRSLNWYGTAIVKRVRSLLVPFVAWNVLYRLFLLTLECVSPRLGYMPHIPFPVYSQVSDVVNAIGINPLALPGHPHLWFVRCLFLYVLISPLVVRVVRKLHSLWCWGGIFLALVFTLLKVPSEVKEFVSYYYSIEGLFYFSFGMALRMQCCRGWTGYFFGKGKALLATGILLSCIPSVCCFVLGRDMEMLAYAFRIAATPFLMYGLWSVMPGRNVFGPLAGCAFPIYILHKFALLFIAGVTGALGMRDYMAYESVSLYFGRMILGVGLICLLVKVIEKTCPRVAAFLFGGRTTLKRSRRP